VIKEGGIAMKGTTTFCAVALSLVAFASIYQARMCRAEDHVSAIKSSGTLEEKSLYQEGSGTATAALQTLRNYSISYKPPHSRVTGSVKSGTITYVCVFPTPRKKNYVLTRAGEKNWVAIIEVTNDAATGNEMFELNSATNYDYGPIPRPEEMTRAEADALWGQKPIASESPSDQDGDVCYKLVSHYRDSLGKDSLGKEFNFLCSFKNGLLARCVIEARK
jgi:hypothetical protein